MQPLLVLYKQSHSRVSISSLNMQPVSSNNKQTNLATQMDSALHSPTSFIHEKCHGGLLLIHWKDELSFYLQSFTYFSDFLSYSKNIVHELNNVYLILALNMLLMLLLFNAQKSKKWWNSSETCHVGIHWKALTEYFKMSTHLP